MPVIHGVPHTIAVRKTPATNGAATNSTLRPYGVHVAPIASVQNHLSGGTATDITIGRWRINVGGAENSEVLQLGYEESAGSGEYVTKMSLSPS